MLENDDPAAGGNSIDQTNQMISVNTSRKSNSDLLNQLILLFHFAPVPCRCSYSLVNAIENVIALTPTTFHNSNLNHWKSRRCVVDDSIDRFNLHSLLALDEYPQEPLDLDRSYFHPDQHHRNRLHPTRIFCSKKIEPNSHRPVIELVLPIGQGKVLNSLLIRIVQLGDFLLKFGDRSMNR